MNVSDEDDDDLVAHLWVELLVPGREERGGHVEPLAVQAQLTGECHLATKFKVKTM